ncbi:MAG: hypothetical protein ABJK37_09275 [Paraglaciecola sp.]|uniref:hypothetical protein n=1 Tax=Paraglaciecola sp. TaxID=1920173 RepID=UPI003296847A
MFDSTFSKAKTRLTFDEDKGVIEAQYKTMKHLKEWIDIHVGTEANHARRIIKSLCEGASTS